MSNKRRSVLMGMSGASSTRGGERRYFSGSENRHCGRLMGATCTAVTRTCWMTRRRVHVDRYRHQGKIFAALTRLRVIIERLSWRLFDWSSTGRSLNEQRLFNLLSSWIVLINQGKQGLFGAEESIRGCTAVRGCSRYYPYHEIWRVKGPSQRIRVLAQHMVS